MVAEVRHGDKGPLGGAHPAIQPERVIHHNKRVRLRWARLGGQLQGARQEGLDDVMLLDLSFLTRHMQAPLESHARCPPAPLAPGAPASGRHSAGCSSMSPTASLSDEEAPARAPRMHAFRHRGGCCCSCIEAGQDLLHREI